MQHPARKRVAFEQSHLDGAPLFLFHVVSIQLLSTNLSLPDNDQSVDQDQDESEAAELDLDDFDAAAFVVKQRAPRAGKARLPNRAGSLVRHSILSFQLQADFSAAADGHTWLRSPCRCHSGTPVPFSRICQQ